MKKEKIVEKSGEVAPPRIFLDGVAFGGVANPRTFFKEIKPPN
jgi:hypothetical protein